jgi:hypothetical protein
LIESEMADEEWRLRETRYLAEQRIIMKQADRFLVSIPDINDKDNIDKPDYHASNVIKYKPEAFKRLRDEVRREQAARREWITRLAPLVIGIIGALSGLVAVWNAANH